MSVSVSVMPLRVASPNTDLRGLLAEWMNSHTDRVEFSSAECDADLQRLGNLRHKLATAMSSHDESFAIMEDFHEYHAALVECESRGFPSLEHNDNSDESFRLEWEAAVMASDSPTEVFYNLTWDRANIIWNIITLQAHNATMQKLDCKAGWSKAAQSFQTAVTLIRYLQRDVLRLPENNGSNPFSPFLEFSPHFLKLWEALLTALSQRCAYESVCCAPKPRHLLLGKLAAAAVPLFKECEQCCQDASNTQQSQLQQLAASWSDYVRAWGMFMSAKAEYHQACIHKDKSKWGQELARLDLAWRFANLCAEFCDAGSSNPYLEELSKAVQAKLEQLRERMEVAQQENNEKHKQPVPAKEELPEIRGEKMVKQDLPVAKVLPALKQPLFKTMLSPSVRRYVDLFRTEMDKLVFQMANVAEERTEAARKALATVNLPHSITAYRQEQSGGGIPPELWKRVESIQRERRIARLKENLWELRDVAEAARVTHERVESQLEDDLESDRLFREQNPGFSGHDVNEVQKTFRHHLANYDRLLVTAQEGDTVLLRRLEILDTNPKYKLLQFQKSQLDRLLPGAGANGPAIDTSHLSRLLVELSALFQEREVLVNTVKEEVKAFDIRSRLAQVDPHSPNAEQEYRHALTYAQKSFDGIVYEMQTNIEKQVALVNTILAENEEFMHARERSQSSSSSDSCIVMIEDAIEEIEELSKHLKEGKDFYDVVIPKLEKLKQQVLDVSARLTVERLEYDDKVNRNRQEEEDAMMAKRMAENGNSNSGGGGGGAASGTSSATGPTSYVHSQPSRPGFAQVSHSEPQVRVDDEKVAALVAMDFDPAKVVTALAKYDNNVDQALNDLLSG